MSDGNFDVEPWCVRERGLDLDDLSQTESVFALANGHLGLRGTLDEGEPTGLGGTYLNGFHERRPLPHAESAYGQPEVGETTVNVTDGKIIRLLVDDELFDVRYGELLRHERTLDLRAGTLHREVHWRSPSKREVRVRSTRMVSLPQRGVAAIHYEVEPVGTHARVVVQSELIANETLGGGQAPAGGDPRTAAALDDALIADDHHIKGELVLLIHHTRRSGLRMAAAMDHVIEGPEGTDVTVEAADDVGRVMITADVPQGQTLRITKFLAYGWSARRSVSSVRAQVRGTVAEARHTGWDKLCELQREYLDRFWDGADVQVDGDDQLQQAVRFALFHVLQAGARGERRAIAAKGLTGSGYDGHAFWDTESFVLPVLSYTAPFAAGDALRWRLSTLEAARERASQLGLRGAAFPWRTIAGGECSGYWPASTAAFHVNADIADAATRHARATADEGFDREVALPLLVETARLWASLGHHDALDEFHVAGVTGPDEYSAVADDNVYTNLMAKRNLEHAADAVQRFAQVAADELDVHDDEVAAWRHAAERMCIPFHKRLQVHPQAQGFLTHAFWDFEDTEPDQYPLMLHFPYFDLYRRQVVKQADLVLALFTCGHAFTPEQKARDFAYYEALTVRDSSLSACTQAIVAAETGHLELAYDYLGEAALMDLHDLEHNTASGLHIASLAGSWLALVAGFGGMRDYGGELHFAPRLPPAINRLAFRLNYCERRLGVEVEREQATYSLGAGEPLTLEHHGVQLTVAVDDPQTRPIEPIEPPEPVSQPPGRAPRRRTPVPATR